MNWDTLGAWTDRGWTLDAEGIAAYNLGYVMLDGRDDVRPVLTSLAGHALGGCYFVCSWPELPTDPAAAAKWVSDRLNLLLPRQYPTEAPPCMIEFEGRSSGWIESFTVPYRQHQPQRPTAAVVAAFQGGNVPTSLLTRQFQLYVECYYGDMSPADAAACVLEQARRLSAWTVRPMYDGANLPADHRDGCVFTLERLPVKT